MPVLAMVCAGLLGWVDNPSPTSDPVAEYRQARDKAGRSPEDQIHLALWCEAHGLTAERMRHLALALLADPANATARGLAGFVSRDGRWVSTDSLARIVRSDPGNAALLAQYDLKRSRTPYSADAQWTLGVWADEQGLKDQAKAHFTAVIRLDPGRDLAWKRLGYRKLDGQWTTSAQFAAARAEAQAQRVADRAWRPLLEKWKRRLDVPADRQKTETHLAEVTDPRSFPSIWAVFGTGDEASQSIAVQLLGQIEGGSATKGLADLAIRGLSPEVRRVALETLTHRDPRECIGLLIPLIQTPWKYEVRPVDGAGSVGELFVEGERYNIRRIFAPPANGQAALANPPAARRNRITTAEPQAIIPLDLGVVRPAMLGGGPIDVERTSTVGNLPVGNPPGAVQQTNRLNNTNERIALNNAQLAQKALDDNVRAVVAANTAIRTTNDRVLAVLTRITGQHLGDDHQAWARWDTERIGFAYSSSPEEKPTFSDVANLPYQDYQRPHTACFAAGTSVRTIDGTKPIERVERGDLVLVQDTTSGVLSYQAVLNAFHNPPSATYRVKFAGDEVVATGIHRFWKAGRGWTMARDLKPGDVIRIIGGVASVEAVTTEPVQLVFNLEVAEGRSFFVGRLGALVHDNSLVEAVTNPFDAVRSVDPSVATANLHSAQ